MMRILGGLPENTMFHLVSMSSISPAETPKGIIKVTYRPTYLPSVCSLPG